jgi:DNA repair ATPase RecN
LNIGADARLPDDRAEELRAKLDAIEAELAELREVDPAFADATTEVEAARAATDAAPAEPAAITDRLKAAAEALASVQKATTAARAIAERLAATAKWVGALLVGP